MSQLDQFVVFSLDEQRYALPLQAIERIVRAVEVTTLPHAPPMVLGVIVMAGRILPVLSLRRHFGLPDRAVVPADRFLIARTALRTVAVVIDEAQGVIERRQSDAGGTGEIAPGFTKIQGVVKIGDDLVLVLDPERWLSVDDARSLYTAIGPPLAHAA